MTRGVGRCSVENHPELTSLSSTFVNHLLVGVPGTGTARTRVVDVQDHLDVWAWLGRATCGTHMGHFGIGSFVISWDANWHRLCICCVGTLINCRSG